MPTPRMLLARIPGPYLGVLLAAVFVILAVVFRHFPVTSSLLCLLSVHIVAETAGTKWGLVTVAALGALLWQVVFPLNPPLVSPVAGTAFLTVSATLCLLQGRLPDARKGESQALSLVSLSHQLGEVTSEDEIWTVLESHLHKEFGPHRLLRADAGEARTRDDERENDVADERADWTSLPEGLGRVGFRSPPEERRLLEAYLLCAAKAVAHLRLARRLHEAELAEATQKLHRALLDSISHDLRIPLVSITGVLSGLLEEDFSESPETRKDLLENALSEAERLHRLVSNLLQMTRLEAGALQVAKKPYDLWEVVTAVLDGSGSRLSGRAVDLDIPEDLPLVPQDPILIGQVLRNLLDNALKYSPPLSPLALEARLLPGWVEVRVLDVGLGIPDAEQVRVFDKFFRGEGLRVAGSGLGLSICEGLVAAHGGRTWVKNRAGGGTEAGFALPLAAGKGAEECLES